jgi:hypothetical protein
MARGAARVREVLAEEHLKMQRRAYRKVRPYLATAMRRLRCTYPAFQTVVFNADKARAVLVFGDGTQPREAPKAFTGLRAACEDLTHLSEIEWLTAGDALWQVRQNGAAPRASEVVIQQYRYVENGERWQFWGRRPLREVRYYVRQDIFSRSFYGSHRAGFGNRIVTESGAVVDEWVDPLEAMILRAFREKGAPISLDPLCSAMAKIASHEGRFPDDDSCFYIWDVLKGCQNLMQKGALRQINPKASEGDARFVLAMEAT